MIFYNSVNRRGSTEYTHGVEGLPCNRKGIEINLIISNNVIFFCLMTFSALSACPIKFGDRLTGVSFTVSYYG